MIVAISESVASSAGGWRRSGEVREDTALNPANTYERTKEEDDRPVTQTNARAAMARGRPDQVRAALLPHARSGLGFMALYLLIWLGRGACNLVHRAVGRFVK